MAIFHFFITIRMSLLDPCKVNHPQIEIKAAFNKQALVTTHLLMSGHLACGSHNIGDP